MNPRERVSLGGVLVWRSLRVVAVDPRLLAYPVLSWLSFVVSTAMLVAVFQGHSFLPRVLPAGGGLAYWLGVADVVLALVGGATLTTLFNAGFVHVTIKTLRDEDPKLRAGLVAALRMLDLVVALLIVPLAVVGAYAQLADLATVTADLLTVVAVVGMLVAVLVRQIAIGVSKATIYIYATTSRTPTAFTGVDLSVVSWGRRSKRE